MSEILYPTKFVIEPKKMKKFQLFLPKSGIFDVEYAYTY